MSRTIAIVDDDAAVRDSLSALLASAGYAVSAFATSAEFLEAARRTTPDGVVLDHQMPGMSGVELAERLAREGRRTAIVMISGNLSDAVRSRARDAGVTAVLEKPFSDEALLAALDSLLE